MSTHRGAVGETVGLGLALIGSVGLGSAIAVARFAYEEGANGLSIALPRAWLLVLLLLIFCEATGRRLILPRRIWLHCLGAGALMAYMFYGNIAAAEFIPAPVAALLFFVYPPLTTLIAAGLDRRPPSPLKLAAVAIAFAGLAVMLGVQFSNLDPRGVALGLAAGVLCAINITWVSRKLAGQDPVVTITHMAFVAALGLTGAAVAVGGPPLPTGASGWAGLLAAAAMQASSIPLLYVALPAIGAERSGVLNNLQPVATIAAAFLLLGETLRAGQFVGAAMILGGIFLMQAAARRERLTAP
jgi:drug/metabolite transporter (DMT)-like permease